MSLNTVQVIVRLLKNTFFRMKLRASIFEDWFSEESAHPIESERTPQKTIHT